MKIRPLRNRLVVVRDEPCGVSLAGLILPEDYRRTRITGRVLAAGDEVRDIRVGDRVVFDRHVTHLEKSARTLAMSEDHVLAVVADDAIVEAVHLGELGSSIGKPPERDPDMGRRRSPERIR